MNDHLATKFDIVFTVRTSISEVRTPIRARTVEIAKAEAENFMCRSAIMVKRRDGVKDVSTTSYGVGIETSQGWQCQAWRTIHPVTGVDSGWVNW